jgi:phenylacetate-CoA ligase
MNQIMPEQRRSRDEMAALQLGALQSVLSYAQQRVPFYQRLFSEQGINPQDITSLDQVAQLPLTQKSDLVNNYPYGMCAVAPSEIIRVHSSSGTTGKPINTYYTAKDQEDWATCMGRNFRMAGITKEDVCQVAFKYTLFTGAFGHHLGAESIGAMVIPTSAGQTERQIMMMMDLKTTVLHCTPSYALVLAEKLKELGIDPQDLALRLGIYGGEAMSEEIREHVEQGLGVTALRDYGLTELGGPGVSIECLHQTGFHINEDYFYPEVIHPKTLQPLPPGEVGELVLTSLRKEAMPLIRYRTRDLTHLVYETCSCGRTLLRHGSLLGRTDDMLIVGGVNFFPSQLESILLGFAEAAPHYAINLSKRGILDEVVAEVETMPDFWDQADKDALDLLSRRVETKIKGLIGFRIHVNLKAPYSIPRFEGKSRRVFDNRKSPV